MVERNGSRGIFSIKSLAQTTVEYEVIFNPTTCAYEAHAHVVGESRVYPNTIPGPAQYTILVPSSVTTMPITVTESVNPPGLPWVNNSSLYAPAADPAHNYHAFAMGGGGDDTNVYPTFNVGDDIHLFSFTLPAGVCGSGIRLYINGSDPEPSELGMGNFPHSFTVFPDEVYGQNRSDAVLVAENPVPDPSTVSCDGTNISLTAAAPDETCFSIASYNWEGPNSFNSAAQNPIFPVAADPALQAGVYTVTITTDNGCTATEVVTLSSSACSGMDCLSNNGVFMISN